MNPYAVLGVHASSTNEEIQTAYRALARALHPDRPGGNADKFAALSVAYAQVRDAAKRQALAARWALTRPKCSACNGAGAERRQRGFTAVELVLCPHCKGAGYL